MSSQNCAGVVEIKIKVEFDDGCCPNKGIRSRANMSAMTCVCPEYLSNRIVIHRRLESKDQQGPLPPDEEGKTYLQK